MTLPLIVLAVFSALGGFVGLPPWLGDNRFERFLEPSLALSLHQHSEAHSHGVEMAFAGLSVLVAFFGILLARRIYLRRPGSADLLAARFGGLYRLIYGKYFVDEAYDRILIDPTVRGSRQILWKALDVAVVDGAVNGIGGMMRAGAGFLKNMQNGLIRSYAAWILVGTLAVLFYLTFMRG